MNLSYSIEEVCETTTLGRTKIYAYIKSGQLKARKIGARTVILRSDLERFLNNLPKIKPLNSGEQS